MTLQDIERDVYRKLDYADAPPTAVSNRVRGSINQRHRELLATDRMRPLRVARTTLTTYAMEAQYALPVGCARITRISDPVSQYELAAGTYEAYRQEQPDIGMRDSGVNAPTMTGTPTHWAPLGYVASMLQLFPPYPGLYINAKAVFANVLDPKFTVVVVREGGIVQRIENITISAPVTSVMPITIPSVPGNPSIINITEFSSDKVPETTINLWGSPNPTTGGIPLAQIVGRWNGTTAVGQARSFYYGFVLYPTPSAAMEYVIDYERDIPELALATDVPLLPLDFHDLLCLLARVDEYEFKSDDRWQQARVQAEARKRELRAWVENHDIYKRTAVPTRRPSHSRLGPFFPPGS